VGLALSDYQGPIVIAEAEWTPEQILRGCRTTTWEFDHLLASQHQFAKYVHVTDHSPTMDLSKGYAEYEKTRLRLGGKRLRDAYRCSRKLEREVGPIRFERHVCDRELLYTLINWKRAQCQRTGTFDYFSLEWTVALIEMIHSRQSSDFGGLLSALYVDDTLLAIHYCLRSSTVWHSWFPAYDHQFANYSPGLILLVQLAKAAAAERIHHIDLGKGADFYKTRFMTGSIEIAEGAVELPSLSLAVRNVRRSVENWARHSRLKVVLRAPGRLIHGLERRRRFR